MNQMVLLADPPKRRNPREGMCKCGHEELVHELPPRHRTRKQCGRCGCPRFRSRMRKKVPIVVPDGAEVLMRPDTVSDSHPMGWRTWSPGRITVYLHQLRTRTPNEYNRHNGIDRDSFDASKAQERQKHVTWAQAALDGVANLDGLARVKIVRVSSQKIRDDDNLVGAMKWIRDGIADAFGIDDSRFSSLLGSDTAGKIPLHYEQRLSGKPGVFGVFIELAWGAT